MNSLAWLLATRKEAHFYNPGEAVELAQRACELTDYKQLELLDTLAAAYAAAGRFSDAVTAAQKTLELARLSEQKELAEEIRDRLGLYKTSQRYVEPAPKISSD